MKDIRWWDLEADLRTVVLVFRLSWDQKNAVFFLVLDLNPVVLVLILWSWSKPLVLNLAYGLDLESLLSS